MSGNTQHLSVLGATGSIGDSTLSLVAQHDHLSLFAAIAHSNWQKMLTLCQTHQPYFAALADNNANQQLRAALKQCGSTTECPDYDEALHLATQHETIDTVVAAITGTAGLPGVFLAAQAGKKIALANKEALVSAGAQLTHICQQYGAVLMPVDSEHNAIYQCLPNCTDNAHKTSLNHVQSIVLTASGGPFLDTPLAEFSAITPEMAVKHPKWSMGKKISVDSATMMNKGLELIEAKHLFPIAPEKLDAVIHRQSTVHGFVEYIDGTFLAHLGSPDMRIAISHAISHPQRINSGAPALSLLAMGKLTFEPISDERFPCYKLAKATLAQDQIYSLILNAANEIAVGAFLDHRLAFTDIAVIVERCLDTFPIANTPLHQTLAVEEIINIDQTCRRFATDVVATIC